MDDIPSLECILRDLDAKEAEEFTGVRLVETQRFSSEQPRRAPPRERDTQGARRSKAPGLFAGLFREEGFAAGTGAFRDAGAGAQSRVEAPGASDTARQRAPDARPREPSEAKIERATPKAVKVGTHARLTGLEGFQSNLNGKPCVVEGLDAETCFVRLPGGFMETVSPENLICD
ncbi:unnamed protein product [Effrenium voratum]|nr:unnamed protein product [Effrenium voratum]